MDVWEEPHAKVARCQPRWPSSGWCAPRRRRPHRSREPLAPTEGEVVAGLTRGDGTWQHLANFPGGGQPRAHRGGTDLEFFRRRCGQGRVGRLRHPRPGRRRQRRPADLPADPQRARSRRAGGPTTAPRTARRRAPASPASSTTPRWRQRRRHPDHRHHRRDGALPRPRAAAASRSSTPPDRRKEFQPREVHLVRFPGFTHTNTVDGSGRGSSTAAAPTSPTRTGST